MKTKLQLVAVLTAALTLSAWGQSVKQPEHPAGTTHPPVLNTAKLWRLNSKAMGLRQKANDTPEAKAATAAEQEVQAEQQVLAKACSDAGYVLGFEPVSGSAPTDQDLACVKPAPPPAEAKKGK